MSLRECSDIVKIQIGLISRAAVSQLPIPSSERAVLSNLIFLQVMDGDRRRTRHPTKRSGIHQMIDIRGERLNLLPNYSLAENLAHGRLRPNVNFHCDDIGELTENRRRFGINQCVEKIVRKSSRHRRNQLRNVSSDANPGARIENDRIEDNVHRTSNRSGKSVSKIVLFEERGVRPH